MNDIEKEKTEKLQTGMLLIIYLFIHGGTRMVFGETHLYELYNRLVLVALVLFTMGNLCFPKDVRLKRAHSDLSLTVFILRCILLSSSNYQYLYII